MLFVIQIFDFSDLGLYIYTNQVFVFGLLSRVSL